jgi:hypothetical protein
MFDPAPGDPMIGARKTLGVCLAIAPGERVALIADEATRSVAASLEQLCDRMRTARLPAAGSCPSAAIVTTWSATRRPRTGPA